MVLSTSISLLACALLLGMTLYMLILKRSVLKTQQQTAALVDALSKEVQGISHGSIGVGRKAMQLQQQVIALTERVDEIVHNDPVKVSYSEASRLVEMGASVEDLMNSCGISRPEAELVIALTTSKDPNKTIPVLTTEV